MRWKQQPQIERPEYPKLVAIAATTEEIQDLVLILRRADPDAEVVNAGARGIYARVHNLSAETAAKRFEESRSFPLAQRTRSPFPPNES